MGRKQTRQAALQRDAPRPASPRQLYARVVALRGAGLLLAAALAADLPADARPLVVDAPTAASAAAVIDDNNRDVADPTGLAHLIVLLPPRFRNVVFVKRGECSFVLVELSPATEMGARAGGVAGDVLHVLRPEHLRDLRADGDWPAGLDEARAVPSGVADGDDEYGMPASESEPSEVGDEESE
ncbi:hypothetical protein HK405_007747, partial [Cladochytrium tenue]